jgi:hypothetical protein
MEAACPTSLRGTPDELLRNTFCVAWSLPSGGITGDLGRPLYEGINQNLKEIYMTLLKFRIKRLCFDCGWYSGEPFILFQIYLFRYDDYILFTFFHIQIVKFIISLDNQCITV